ncbi:MAG: putative Peptidase family M28 [Promethearchaeota archaeon]|nr:MAG: putative Peptidase family M28 [Candidatus Lokiarchaeota archaeon]
MIDAERIEKNLEGISFPRLSGTEHEQQASKLIIQKIEELGLNPEIQKFSFTTFYPRVYKKLAFCSIWWLLVVFFLYINIIFILINIVILSIIFVPLIIITRHPEDISLGEKYQSENVCIKLDAKVPNHTAEKSNKIQFLLLSHKDSKCQKLTITFRSINTKVWIYSFIIIVALLILKYFFISNIIFNLIIACILLLNLISTVLILVNTTNNKSPGAIDNGSGVSLVLELLHHFNKIENRLTSIDLWFIFTGAEENGTMGIRYLYRKHKQEWHHQTTRYLNFDSIGTHLDVFAVKNKGEHTSLFKLFADLSEELDPSYYIKYFIFALNRSDGYYLKNKNYKGIGFADKKAYKYIHSPKDTVDKVDHSFLAQFGRVLITLLEEYDKKISKPYS